jgi:hypothetical protein
MLGQLNERRLYRGQTILAPPYTLCLYALFLANPIPPLYTLSCQPYPGTNDPSWFSEWHPLKTIFMLQAPFFRTIQVNSQCLTGPTFFQYLYALGPTPVTEPWM